MGGGKQRNSWQAKKGERCGLTAHELSGAPQLPTREAGHGCGARPLERKVRRLADTGWTQILSTSTAHGAARSVAVDGIENLTAM